MRPRALALGCLASALFAAPARAQTAPVAPPPELAPPLVAEPPAPPPASEPAPPAAPAPPPPAYAPPPPAAPAPPPPPSAPQSYASNASAAPPVIATPAPPPPALGRAPAEDPQADRGILMPTAYTHPKGTWFISDYELALVQGGVALTDDTQLTLTTVPPLGAERIGLVDLSLKTSLYRGARVRVAAIGSTSGLIAKEIGVLGVGRAGAVVQFCLESACGTSVSMSSNLTLAGVMLMANGVSGIYRVGRTLSLLAELDSLVPLTRDAGAFGGASAGGGFRWKWTNWGLDLSFMHVLNKPARVTLPFLAITYRSSP